MELFVAGLPFDMDQEELQEIFQDFGTVTATKIIIDRETNKSRGFGFVTMPVAAEAEKAIKEVDGSSIEGRRLTVKVAEAKKITFRDKRSNSSQISNSGGYNSGYSG
jgi:cold-inducible RNA-binding protein